MRASTSNGMLCSGASWAVRRHEGILVLAPDGAGPGTPLVDALGIEPDVVFDIAVEANRPDAWCVAAWPATWRLPSSPVLASPSPARLAEGHARGRHWPRSRSWTRTCARASRPGSCSTWSSGPSPVWVHRRLTLAGMRPINNVVDASNTPCSTWASPPTPTTWTPGRSRPAGAGRPGR